MGSRRGFAVPVFRLVRLCAVPLGAVREFSEAAARSQWYFSAYGRTDGAIREAGVRGLRRADRGD
jgi:hypothetical protein